MPATSASALNNFGQHIPARSDTPPLPPSMAPGPPDSSDFSGAQMPFLHGGLSFNLQHVTSESVAALAQQVVTPTLCQRSIRVLIAPSTVMQAVLRCVETWLRFPAHRSRARHSRLLCLFLSLLK